MNNRLFEYAGIENVHKVSSIDVKTNSHSLRRFQTVFRHLMLIGAGHLPARKEWEIKQAIGRHIYEDAESASSLRERVLELRTTEAQAGKDPDGFLTLLMDEVLHAQSDAEYLLGVYEILRPTLLESIVRHMQETQPLVDQPTIRCMRLIKLDLEDQITLGGHLITQFVTTKDREESSDYLNYLRSTLRLIGGINGCAETKSTPQRWRSVTPYVLPLKSARSEAFGPRVHTRQPGCLESNLPDEVNALLEMMKVRQEEMTAAELVAGVLYSQANMPWEFYRTLARHIWDEVRHSAFGQAALESHGIDWRSCPQYVAEYDQFRKEIPAKAYTFLSLGIEHTLMMKGGKQHEVKLCKEIFKDPQMALFQDYDWADEVTHANFGKKWGSSFFDDDFEQSKKYGEQFVNELVEYTNKQEPNPDQYRGFFFLEKFGNQPCLERAREACKDTQTQ